MGRGPDYAQQSVRREQHTANDQATAQATLDEYRDKLAGRARDTGLQSAEAADAEFVDRVLDWLYDLAPGVSVSADDARREFGTSSAMGAVFRTASRRGVLQPIGLKESTTVTRRKGLQRVWRRT